MKIKRDNFIAGLIVTCVILVIFAIVSIVALIDRDNCKSKLEEMTLSCSTRQKPSFLHVYSEKDGLWHRWDGTCTPKRLEAVINDL